MNLLHFKKRSCLRDLETLGGGEVDWLFGGCFEWWVEMDLALVGDPENGVGCFGALSAGVILAEKWPVNSFWQDHI